MLDLKRRGLDVAPELAIAALAKTLFYGAKSDKAVACLTEDRSALLAFYDFPAEHWKHLRSTNPIEHICNRAPSNHPLEGLPVEQNRARNGL